MSRWTRIRTALTPASGAGRGCWRRPSSASTRSASSSCSRSSCRTTTASPAAGSSALGVGITAYTLGLRHAFDADHIAAIDNTTRKLMADGQRPLSVGFFFSLGHSTIVFVLGALVVARRARAERRGRERRLDAAPGDGRRRPGGVRRLPAADRRCSTSRSCVTIVRMFRDLRHGDLDEARARGAARVARVHEPLFRARDAGDPQAVADVPARLPVRPRLRHRDRGRAARARRRRGGQRAAVLRDPLPADPVRGRHVAVRHDRRRVHELRLRLGVLAAGPQALLQHHRHRAVGGRRARHRLDRAARRARRRSATSTSTSSAISWSACSC